MGLFRYQLIQEVTGQDLSSRQRGVLIRELAGRVHEGPGGQQITVSPQTIRRRARDWRAGGFEALVPRPARVSPRTPAEVLALAVALKKENPDRTAAQVTRILAAQSGWAPHERTIQRHFEMLELGGRRAAAAAGQPAAFSRFEASRPNEIWTGDALHGPVITGRKTYLFAFIDDHSRAVMAARFGFAEDTIRLAAALRPALASRGVPSWIYPENVPRNIFRLMSLPALCAGGRLS
jgi:putative transposase